MKRYLKYFLRALAVMVVLFIIVFFSAYIYVSAHKKEIIQRVRTEVSQKLNGDVQLRDVELTFWRSFPEISVLLHDISIKDTLYKQHKHPFFQAKQVYASISALNLIRKINPLTGIRVENGQLYVFTDTSGYSNIYLFKPKSEKLAATTNNKTDLDIEKVKFYNVRLIMDNQQKKKLFDVEIKKLVCKIRTKGDVIKISSDNSFIIHDLAFNKDNGSFGKETGFDGSFDVQFDKQKKQLSFNDIDVKLKGHPFRFTGAFNLTDQPNFSLKIYTDDVDFNMVRGMLTPKLSNVLSMIKLSNTVDEATASIEGPLNGGDPLVKINWKISDNDVESPFVSLDDVTVEGSFVNEIVPGLPRKDPNSRLHFTNLKGSFAGIPVTSPEAFIDNLTEPELRCNVKSSFNLTQLNDVLESNTLHLHDGTGSLDLTYSGPLRENNNRNTLLNGQISFADGVVMYHPRNIEIKNVSGNIVFKNTDVYVNDFKGSALGNRVVMNGSGKNLLALMNTSPGKMMLDWNIYSPSLNLNALNSLLKKRTSVAAAPRKKARMSSAGRQVDEIVDQANFNLYVKADKLTYSKFVATNVVASLGLVNENWFLRKIALQHAGGIMSVSGSLTEKDNRYYSAAVQTNMNNVDVNKVMYAFNNFGQNGIEAENLRGKVTADIDAKMDIDRNLLAPSNINGVVNFSLKNGALINYEPIKKIQNVVFKKRNFDEIYFAELKDKIEIKDKEIKINRMEIQSTALTLFIEGLYNLDPKGTTDISIQVPLSNLKKRGDEYVPVNKGADSKSGASVFVRGRPGSDGKIAFKLDLFKKFRKDDKKDKQGEKELSDSTKNDKAKATATASP